jgi:hypothetical protein
VGVESSKSLGRITGLLLLVHLAGGLILPYILLQPALAAPAFSNAAPTPSGSARPCSCCS